MSASKHQPQYLHALSLSPVALTEEMQKYFDICVEKLGYVPNVLQSYSFDQEKLKNFVNVYNGLMLGESGLTELQREMIAVVVSSVNGCYYCLVSHGAAVRELSDDPVLGEMLVMNYRVAELSECDRAMLEFAEKMTVKCASIFEADRQRLRDVGFSDSDIWDIAEVTAFFNMTNRLATAVDMMPNSDYHSTRR